MIPEQVLESFKEHLEDLRPEIKNLILAELNRATLEPSEAETHLNSEIRGVYEKDNKEYN